MTLREKLRSDFPDKYNDVFTKQGVAECPRTFNYESQEAKPCKNLTSDQMTCNACWDREYVPASTTGCSILDSGERRQFETGAVRDIQEGKGRCDLMPLEVVAHFCADDTQETHPVLSKIAAFMASNDTEELYFALGEYAKQRYDSSESTMFLEVAKHFEEGAKKYGENNWQKGLPVHCYIDSAVRHYLKWLRGDKDEPHDRAFVWNLMCCIWESKFSPRATSKNDQDEPVMVMNCATGPHPVRVSYLCDKRACPECNNPNCRHTQDINHAVNFECVEIADASGGRKFTERTNVQTLFENAAPGLYEVFDCPCVKGADSVVYTMATGCPLDTTTLAYFRSLSLDNIYRGIEGRTLSTAPAGALFYHEGDAWLKTDVNTNAESVYAVRLRDGKPEHISGTVVVAPIQDVDFK